jgi:SusD family.
MKKIFAIAWLIVLLTLCVSCEKFVEVGPPKTETVLTEAFKEDGTATSAVLGIYINMLIDRSFLNAGMTLYGGLAADELESLSNNNPDDALFQQNQLVSVTSTVLSMWTAAYQNLVLINTCIEGLESSSTLSPAVKQQLLGECRFNRALINFYLVNLFGEIPLVTTTNYRVNSVLSRSSIEDVYILIFSDLKEAQTLLIDTSPTEGRVRPNKWAATALLARAYLYHKDYVDAEIEATKVIDAGGYGPLPALNATFKKESTETIWQLMPTRNIVYNTAEANIFLDDISYGVNPAYQLTDNALNSFEAGDNRRTVWLNSIVYQGKNYYYPNKYTDRGDYSNPISTEYYVMFRVAEQYLIRAEARTHQNNLSGARDDVNVIRKRAGLMSVPLSEQAEMLGFIERENRHEFIAEWGHRWFDLKRTGRANDVLGSLKPDWSNNDLLFPIPQTEISLNNNLTQNPGY